PLRYSTTKAQSALSWQPCRSTRDEVRALLSSDEWQSPPAASSAGGAQGNGPPLQSSVGRTRHRGAVEVSSPGGSRAARSIAGLVSIVVPCYRGERFLREALQSCLAQTYSPIEILVVDDASPDGCLAIASEFAARDSRIRVISRPLNGGVAKA